jgi:hypothetical protein
MTFICGKCTNHLYAAAAAAAESVKPRGVVDLSKVQDVRDGRSVTGKANTVQLKTASGGSVCYICESGACNDARGCGSTCDVVFAC